MYVLGNNDKLQVPLMSNYTRRKNYAIAGIRTYYKAAFGGGGGGKEGT